MPPARIVFYCEEDGYTPVLEWLNQLRKREPKAYALCLGKIGILRLLGHEVRRPHADYLRDKIYELRVTYRNTQYRILYFYHGQEAVVLSHGLTKEQVVPTVEIDKAIARMERFAGNPKAHTYEKDLPL